MGQVGECGACGCGVRFVVDAGPRDACGQCGVMTTGRVEQRAHAGAPWDAGQHVCCVMCWSAGDYLQNVRHADVCEGVVMYAHHDVDTGHAAWMFRDARRGDGYGLPCVLTPEGVAGRVLSHVVSVQEWERVDSVCVTWRIAGVP